MTIERKLQLGVWIGTGLLVAVSIARWAQVRLADGDLGSYELFPLFGLLAFTLMWTHFVSGAMRRLVGAKKGTLRTFFTVTNWLVLAFILLHPGIFMFTLWADGLGLPPTSYLSIYIDLGARIALFMGTLSLVAFLAYELRRRFKKASWWRFVEYANIAAMFAIFFHALTLGGEVASGWFRVLWILYGVTLAAAIGYNYYYSRRTKKEKRRA
jgi:hypothetical protein